MKEAPDASGSEKIAAIFLNHNIDVILEYGWNIQLEFDIIFNILKHLNYNRIINSLRPSDVYMRRNITIIGPDNDLSPGRRQAEPMLVYC